MSSSGRHLAARAHTVVAPAAARSRIPRSSDFHAKCMRFLVSSAVGPVRLRNFTADVPTAYELLHLPFLRTSRISGSGLA